MEHSEYELSVQEIFTVLKKRWLLAISIPLTIIITTVICLLFVIKPTYEAQTTLIVNYKEQQEVLLTYSGLQMSQQLVPTYMQIVKSEKIADEVIKKINIDIETEKFIKKIKVSQLDNTEILSIEVKDKDPQLAALIANTIAQVFQEEINNMMKVDNVSIIDVAKVPESPATSKILIIGLMGVIGIVSALVIIFILELCDRTLKTVNDVERHFQLPIIGMIPDMMIEE